MSETKQISRQEKLFGIDPIWKTLLKMAVPTMIMMLVFGLYTFMDNVLSINLANDNYKTQLLGNSIITSKDQVRLFMSSIGPISTFMFAFSLLFGVGLSSRFSINIGSKKTERAMQTLKTTIQVSLFVSFLLIPILLFSAKPWMKSQFNGNSQMAEIISNEGYKYIWIIIISFPIQVFNQSISGVFRTEARNKQVLIASTLPLIINLLLDWVFMGPLKMGIEGGAWATFISYILTTAILVFFMIRNKDSRIKLKNIFGKKGFKIITIVGVLLLGVAPFMRNMAQSITQTIQFQKIQDVSSAVYGSPLQMSIIMTGVFPIFALFFPILFAFVQAASPIMGYNYGAKNIDRVKKTTWLLILYSTITGLIIYLISTLWLIDPLNEILGVENKQFKIMASIQNPSKAYDPINNLAIKDGIYKLFTNSHKTTGFEGIIMKDDDGNSIHKVLFSTGETFHTLDKAKKMYSIMFMTAIFFGPAIGAMSLFGSTDRIFLNLIASSLRGLILLFPFLYGFSALTINHEHDIVNNLIGNNSIWHEEYLFWWFNPILSISVSLILFTTAMLVMKSLKNKHTTIEQRLEKIHIWNKRRIKKRS